MRKKLEESAAKANKTKEEAEQKRRRREADKQEDKMQKERSRNPTEGQAQKWCLGLFKDISDARQLLKELKASPPHRKKGSDAETARRRNQKFGRPEGCVGEQQAGEREIKRHDKHEGPSQGIQETIPSCKGVHEAAKLIPTLQNIGREFFPDVATGASAVMMLHIAQCKLVVG